MDLEKTNLTLLLDGATIMPSYEVMMMKRIAVVGNKGGVGKTFFASHLAWALAERTRVTLVDTDYGQYSALRWLTGVAGPPGTDGKGVWTTIAPGYAAMTVAAPTFDQIGATVEKGLNNDPYMVVDGRPEPRVTAAILEHMSDGDVVFLPLVPGIDSVKQAHDLYNVIEQTHKKLNKFVVLNMYIRARVSRYIFEKIRDQYGFSPTDILPMSDYVKWSELKNIPVWALRGGRRTKIPNYFELVRDFIIAGRF